MNYDRRVAPRIFVNLPATWEGVFETNEATITSLSLNGCFVLSGGTVLPKELVRMEIQLPDQPAVHVWAEVVDQAYEIGFAARFTSPGDDEDQARLMKFVAAALEAKQAETT